jgi:hypothetical protein
MIHLGIDLGKEGAIVAIDDRGRITWKIKTPLLKASTKRGKKQGRDEYDIPGMRAVLLRSDASEGIYVCIEKAHTLPAAMGGSTANFQRGLSYGLWQGLLVGLEIPYLTVAPQTWQKRMFEGINADDTKQASAIASKRLWPKEDWRRSELAKKIDDGLTDAALIGEFGRRTLAIAVGP